MLPLQVVMMMMMMKEWLILDDQLGWVGDYYYVRTKPMIESLFRADHGLLATTNLDSMVILMVMNESCESFH